MIIDNQRPLYVSELLTAADVVTRFAVGIAIEMSGSHIPVGAFAIVRGRIAPGARA